MTTRSDIETKNIHSLGFWDTRARVTLSKLILQSASYDAYVCMKQILLWSNEVAFLDVHTRENDCSPLCILSILTL